MCSTLYVIIDTSLDEHAADITWDLKLAVSKLVELSTGEIYGVQPVVLNLDIGPQLHSMLIGKEDGNIRKIMDATDIRYARTL